MRICIYRYIYIQIKRETVNQIIYKMVKQSSNLRRMDLRTNHVVILRRGSACHRYILHQSSIARLKVGDTFQFYFISLWSETEREISLYRFVFFSLHSNFLSVSLLISLFVSSRMLLRVIEHLSTVDCARQTKYRQR